MSRHVTITVLLAAMVLLAGCVGGFGGGANAPATGESTATATADSTTEATTDTSTEENQGRLNFYVSDEKNAISQFEHVNVTITRVGLHPVKDGAEAESENETADDENATATATSETNEPDAKNGWKTYDVDNRTVDLTKLQGDNATRLASFDVSNGSYDKVFVYVSEVNATLKDGTSENVKLPSGKLQITEQFTVGNGESVDFVFDITVVEAGKSGKYILKPVISESGTDVPIESVDDPDEQDAASESENATSEAELNASFADAVERGENATLSVTRDGSPVANATVAVNGERVGTTDESGNVTVAVPRNETKLKVTVTAADAETELEVEFESS